MSLTWRQRLFLFFAIPATVVVLIFVGFVLCTVPDQQPAGPFTEIPIP